MVTGTLSFSVHLLFSIPIANPNSYPCSSPPPLRPRRRLCPCSRGNGTSSWGSNVEDVRTGKFRFRDGFDGGGGDGFRGREKRKWWSDESSDEIDGEYDFFDDESEEIWDKIWIFKVFKSYGYLLPAIIASMLLTTGPKAFLMALALPLGQSALSLAYEKVWGKERERPMPRSKTKKKPFNRRSNGFKWQEDEDENESTRANEARQDYQSWVAAGGGRAEKGKARVEGFGGWDELDVNREFRKKAVGKQSSQKDKGSVPQAEPLKRGKLSRRSKRKDTPFLLRLLIAVFPFLGSWTRML